jgi:sulfhydrogenase subunit beta (sulfur reductase)
MMSTSHGEPQFLPKAALQTVIDALRAEGHTVIGPTVDQEAIVYQELHEVAQLPIGWTDEQAPGHYRLKPRDDEAWFGYAVGPHSWKRYLFPPNLVVSSAEHHGETWTFQTPPIPTTRYAFLGVRACELAALSVQDRVFAGQAYQDPYYQAMRANAFLIAVNCTQAAATCFCPSMGTGPRCTVGFDLALTELDDGFIIETGTSRGAALLTSIATRAATAEELAGAAAQRQQAVDQITRTMETTDLRDRFFANLQHPRWDELGERCLSCTNCTMVCPTCFCHSVVEVRDLNQDRVDRERRWDSCFTPDFSQMSGGPVRNTTAARYRQWLTHKLASWHDQFDTSGCVGCGRCITWCPVGIDLTVETAIIAGASPA